MILDSTTEKITLILAGATTTNPGDCDANWTTSDPAAVLPTPTFGAGSNPTVTNGTTPVDLVPVPTTATMRVSVQDLSVVNSDTAPMTVTIRKTDGATHRKVFGPVVLQVGEKIQFTRESGWNVFTVTGAVKVTSVQSTVDPGLISGLAMRFNSGTSYSVTSGLAYIPSLGANLNLPSDITKAGLSLTASTWYHLYLFDNAGVADIEHSTTAPSSPYNGTARTKTGDPTRRYVGSIRTDSTGAIFNFYHSGDYVGYKNSQDLPPFRSLSNGNATTPTTVSLAATIPVTSRIGNIRGINTATAGAVFLKTSDDSTSVSSPAISKIDPSRDAYVVFPLNASQAVQYSYTPAPTGTGFYLDVNGYLYER